MLRITIRGEKMNDDKINKIANELAKRIENDFSRAKKLRISSICMEHKGSNPFREFFSLGFYVGEYDGVILYFYSITEASASVGSSNPYESEISYDEAREILSRVKKILSQKFEIEYYDDDDDEYEYDYY